MQILQAGRYAEAVSAAQAAVELRPGHPAIYSISAASRALAGDLVGAKRDKEMLLSIAPSFTASHVERIFPYYLEEDLKRLVSALR